jgi:DeoR family transcriptional regulator, fructose operon transcriptional repressor
MATRSSLDAERRREGLLDLLRGTGSLRIDEAATSWQVHPMTIRRDLRDLEEQGVARVVRGGAVYVGPTDFARRLAQRLSAKRRIADKAARMVTAGSAVGVDASSTLHEVVCRLSTDDLFAVTYGLENFQVLDALPGVRTYLTGGERDHRTGSMVGPLAVRALAGFSLDRCFLSTTAVDIATGCSEPTVEEVEVKQAMAAVSAQVVLLVDSSKLDGRAHVRSLPWDDVDVLVTELEPDDARLDAYRELVEVV